MYEAIIYLIEIGGVLQIIFLYVCTVSRFIQQGFTFYINVNDLTYFSNLGVNDGVIICLE